MAMVTMIIERGREAFFFGSMIYDQVEMARDWWAKD